MSKPTGPYTSDGTTIRALARAIGSLVQTDGDHHTSIPALTLHRRSGPTEPLHCIYNLGLGVVAQGDKQVLLGEESIDYGPGQSMLTTIDLPIVSHVTRASGAEPFLGMMLTLDVRSIVQMASEMDEPRPRREDVSRSISFEVLDADLLDALVRLVKLLGQPALVPGLAPLIQQKIILRLLTGPHGPQLRRLVSGGSPSQQIAKAVAWLKQNFVETLDGDDLADRAHMSPSTFRQHFRALTGVSPLQYQKQLRLQEARQLMLNENLDAGSAGGRVGYESSRNSVASTVGSSARRLSVMSRACGSLRWVATPIHVKHSRGPRLVQRFHAANRVHRRSYPDELFTFLELEHHLDGFTVIHRTIAIGDALDIRGAVEHEFRLDSAFQH